MSGRTAIHALIGAVVGIVLSFIPFSTVLGGAVAGFLQGPDGRSGAITGALAGAITFVPIAAMALLMLGVLGFGMGIAAVPIEGFALVLFVTAIVSMLVLLYTVGLAMLGGYLGAYLAREYPEQRTRTRRTIGMERRDPIGHAVRPRPDARTPRRTAGDDRERARRDADLESEWGRARPRRGDRGRDRDRDPRTRRDDRDRRAGDENGSESSGSDRAGEDADTASGTDGFRPDPHDRLDPTRWREGEGEDEEGDRERDREPTRERDREPTRERE